MILFWCISAAKKQTWMKKTPGQQKSQMDVSGIFFYASIVYRERGFVLFLTDGNRKRNESSARHFTETRLTGDQIIEHFSLKNNVQM